MTTEITNAAWKLADDLKNAEHGRLGSFSETGALRHAFARRIQEASDVAKALSRPITTDDFTCEGPLALMRRLRSISKALQSLILPDEPCHHLIGVLHVENESLPEVGAIKCVKCGKRLKIVEATDD